MASHCDDSTLKGAIKPDCDNIFAAETIYEEHFRPRATARALSYFVDGNLPKPPGSMQNALRSAATSVKLEELPEFIGRRDRASKGKEQ